MVTLLFLPHCNEHDALERQAAKKREFESRGHPTALPGSGVCTWGSSSHNVTLILLHI